VEKKKRNSLKKVFQTSGKKREKSEEPKKESKNVQQIRRKIWQITWQNKKTTEI